VRAGAGISRAGGLAFAAASASAAIGADDRSLLVARLRFPAACFAQAASVSWIVGKKRGIEEGTRQAASRASSRGSDSCTGTAPNGRMLRRCLLLFEPRSENEAFR